MPFFAGCNAGWDACKIGFGIESTAPCPEAGMKAAVHEYFKVCMDYVERAADAPGAQGSWANTVDQKPDRRAVWFIVEGYSTLFGQRRGDDEWLCGGWSFTDAEVTRWQYAVAPPAPLEEGEER